MYYGIQYVESRLSFYNGFMYFDYYSVVIVFNQIVSFYGVCFPTKHLKQMVITLTEKRIFILKNKGVSTISY